MLVEREEPKQRTVNRAGEWHLKIINIGDRLNDKHNDYLRVTCISKDDRIFVFPIYMNDNGMELIQLIAQAIGSECFTDDGTIDTNKFIGGFMYATLAEYTGENEAYESGYYVKWVRSSSRRYDRTGSPTFKRVKQSNRGGSVYRD